MIIKSKRIFLRKFSLLIITVGNPIVLYNLKICSPSKESSRNSVGGALYREHGPSEDGNPALFFFPFYTTLQSSLNYIVAHSSSFAAILYYARLKSSVEYLCIVLFSLYYISQGFLLLIGNFTLSKCTLKLRTCVGTLLNLSVIKWKNKVFSLMPI